MTVQIESAWPKYPDYRIDLMPVHQTARVWFDGRLLAESRNCLRMEETRHVHRLYFPEADVHWEHFTFADGVHTICPFKGEADYWSLTAVEPAEENLVWTYREPMDEVAGIRGYVCFYHERAKVEIDEPWPDDPDGYTRVRRFPAWGDQAELARLMDVVPTGPGAFAAPAYGYTPRNVVEGGQLLGQGIVAVCKTVPDQRVVSGYMTFAKAASFDQPVEVTTEALRAGRNFSTVNVRIDQDGSFRSGGTFLLGGDVEDSIRGSAPMPEIVGPEQAVFLDMGVEGRELRIIDGQSGELPPEASQLPVVVVLTPAATT